MEHSTGTVIKIDFFGDINYYYAFLAHVFEIGRLTSHENFSRVLITKLCPLTILHREQNCL